MIKEENWGTKPILPPPPFVNRNAHHRSWTNNPIVMRVTELPYIVILPVQMQSEQMKVFSNTYNLNKQGTTSTAPFKF